MQRPDDDEIDEPDDITLHFGMADIVAILILIIYYFLLFY